MLENNQASESLNDNNDINASNENQQQDPTATPEDIENANKPQPNVILSKIPGAGHISSSHRDKNRVEARANEAPDSTDTNTGGIVSGAAKGTSQS